MKFSVMIVGGDLSSNGGISSVIKSYYHAYKKDNYDFDFFLLKTTEYKHGNKIINCICFISALLKFIYRLISNRHIKIIHIHTSSHLSFYRKYIFFLTALLFRKQTIIHLHSSRFNFFADPSKTVVRKMITYTFSHASAVILLCNNWKNILVEKYKNSNFITLYNPIEIEPAQNFIDRNKDTKHKFTVLFIGFLIKNKGILDFIKVAEYFKDTNNEIIFQIAGIGELKNHIEDYISKTNNSNIEYVGWADTEKKDKLYRNADLFFLPSYNEGMPIVLLEAMKWSLPIISTDIAGIPEEISNGVNGFLYNPGNIEGYIQGIEKLYNNASLRHSFAFSSWQKIKEFSNIKIFDQLVVIYKELVNCKNKNY